MKQNKFNPASIINYWKTFNKYPMGKWLFSKIAGWAIPYTGSVNPRVELIEPGKVIVKLKDQRKVRNHLNSIHAIALANIGEFTSGLVLFSKAPENAIAIITKLEVEYLKKARGDLTAHAELLEGNYQNDMENVIKVEIKNTNNDIVTISTATWRIRRIE